MSQITAVSAAQILSDSWSSRIYSLPAFEQGEDDAYIIDAVSPDLSDKNSNLDRKKFVNSIGDMGDIEPERVGALIIGGYLNGDQENAGEDQYSCNRFSKPDIAFAAEKFAQVSSSVRCIWVNESELAPEGRTPASLFNAKFHKQDITMGVISAFRSGVMTGVTLVYSGVAGFGSLAFLSAVSASLVGSYLLGAYWFDMDRFFNGKLFEKEGELEIDVDKISADKIKGRDETHTKRLNAVFDYIKFNARKTMVLLTYDAVRRFLADPAQFLTAEGFISLVKRRVFGLITSPAEYVATKAMFAGYISPQVLKWLRELNYWVGGSLSMAVLWGVQEITINGFVTSPDAFLLAVIGVNSVGHFANHFIQNKRFKKILKVVQANNQKMFEPTDIQKRSMLHLLSVTGADPATLKVEDLNSYALQFNAVDLREVNWQLSKELMNKMEVKYANGQTLKGRSFFTKLKEYFFGKKIDCDQRLFGH